MEEAIYGDCHLLISNFVQNENASFEIFCAEWKKLHFQHIFTAQTTYIELQQTVAAAFHVGKRLMCNRKATESTDDFNEIDVTNEESKIIVRIGGLYLLYTMYFKQPLERYTKIEVSPETWHEMKKFVRVTLSTNVAGYDEACFIFWKLYQSQAFRFTAMDYCVGLENLVDYDNLDRSATNSASKDCVGISRLIEKLSSFTEVKQTTAALVALEEGYNQMKSSLTQMHKLDGQLLPPINIFQNIRDCFGNIEKILNKSEEIEIEASGSSGSKQKSLKRSLKDKAFAAQKSTTPSPNTDDEKLSRKPAKRMSSRTIFAEKLPKDVVADLKEEADCEMEDGVDDETVQTEISQVDLDVTNNTNDSNDSNESAEEDEDPLNTEGVTKACKELLEDL